MEQDSAPRAMDLAGFEPSVSAKQELRKEELRARGNMPVAYFSEEGPLSKFQKTEKQAEICVGESHRSTRRGARGANEKRHGAAGNGPGGIHLGESHRFLFSK